MGNNYLLIGSTVLFVLLLWGVVGFRYLNGLRGRVRDQWETVDDMLRLRADLVPNLIETVRRFDDGCEGIIGRLIELRSNVVERDEDAFGRGIGELFAGGRENEGLMVDVNFLELKTEINDLNRNIGVGIEMYDEMAGFYNSRRGMWLLLPIGKVLGFKKAL